MSLRERLLAEIPDDILDAAVLPDGLTIRVPTDNAITLQGYDDESVRETSTVVPKPEFNARLMSIAPSKTTASLDLVQQLKRDSSLFVPSQDELDRGGLIDLTIGQPNWTLPSPMWEKLKTSLEPVQWARGTDGEPSIYNTELLRYTKYSPRRGIPDLLDAIGANLNIKQYGLQAQRDMMLSIGVKSLLYFATTTLVRPSKYSQDIVIYCSPTWGLYHSQVTLAGGLPLDLPLMMNDDGTCHLDIDAIKATITKYGTSRIRAIILCTPNNPTSTEIPMTDINTLIKVLSEEGMENCFLIIDEIYGDLIFDPVSAINKRYSIMPLFGNPLLRNRLLLVNGFSKLHSLCGMRLGYAISNNTQLIDKMLIMGDNVASCAPTITQWIALESFSREKDMALWKATVLEEAKTRTGIFYNILKDRLKDFIAQGDMMLSRPTGGFYVYMRIRDTTPTIDWVERLLNEERVASIPGIAFRPCQSYNDLCDYQEIRFSLGTVSGVNEVRVAATRVARVLSKLHSR